MTKAPFPTVIDSTMRGAFVACPKKFWWEFVRKLGPAKTSIHLHFGACFARGLEVWRFAIHYKKMETEAALHAGIRAIIEEWGDYEPDVGELKSLENCILAFEAYTKHYPPKTDLVQPYKKVDGTPAVEFSFAIPVTGTVHPDTGAPVIYAGRFDMMGVYNNQIFVVDEKTTKQLGPSWLNQWDMRAQFTGYCFAAREYGLPVAGAIVRGVAIKQSEFAFAEVITYRPDWFVNKWREQLQRDINRMIQCYQMDIWDMDFDSACTAYGGCQFKILCEKPDEHQAKWIDQYFVERNWNPLEKDPLRGNEEG